MLLSPNKANQSDALRLVIVFAKEKATKTSPNLSAVVCGVSCINYGLT